MPSRKKEKGKERKAKKQEAEIERKTKQDFDFGVSIGCICCEKRELLNLSPSLCRHGHNHPMKDPWDGALCSKLVSELFKWQDSDPSDLSTCLGGICRNPKLKEISSQILLSMAVDYLLTLPSDINLPPNAHLCNADISLSHHFKNVIMAMTWVELGWENILKPGRYGFKTLDLESDVSNAIHFIDKRTPCHCLDDLRERFKIDDTHKTIYRCFHCQRQMMKKSDSMLCHCQTAQYCSRDCQVSDWPEHKYRCRQACNINKKIIADIASKMQKQMHQT